MEKKSLVMVDGRAVAYYRLGPLMAPKLVLIHGSASSSAVSRGGCFPAAADGGANAGSTAKIR